MSLLDNMFPSSLSTTIQRVQNMTYDYTAKNLATKYGLSINTVTWEDCARNKNSVWGPCISDMTLQVGDSCMPVIRFPNYTDKTWDVAINKIPIIIGNELSDENSKLKTITLQEYLKNFSQYISKPGFNKKSLNLLIEDNNSIRKDTHVIMSSQCCFLPIEQGKETKFNVALYNYQSRKSDPAVLVIVSTSKGTSASILEGQQQKLLFNNHGRKADFVGQRISDNRKEKGLSTTGPMTQQEKQDNVIVIIQVPLKQKQPVKNDLFDLQMELDLFSPVGAVLCDSLVSLEQKVNVEDAIVKIAPKTSPTCICGKELIKDNVPNLYSNNAKVSCDLCRRDLSPTESAWHCKQGKTPFQHRDGYDLCIACGELQLKFDELNGLDWIERDTRYSIRVTLQYYKSTDNGIINEEIMKDILKQLETSQKQSDFIGSLVTGNTNRPTEPDLISNNNNNDKYYKIKEALKKLDMEQYINQFILNEVTDKDLLLLETGHVKELIDKIGPRSRFETWLKQYKNSQSNEVNFWGDFI